MYFSVCSKFLVVFSPVLPAVYPGEIIWLLPSPKLSIPF